MFVSSSGNVGIGTTGPAYKLHLAGGSEYIEGGFGTNTATAYTATNRLIFNNDYSDVARGPNKITLYDSSWLAGFGIHNDTLAYYTGGTHRWYQATDATNAAHLMTLNSSGNLGIGTTAPGAKLDVSGNIYVRSGNELRLYNPAGNDWGVLNFTSTNDLNLNSTVTVKNSGGVNSLYPNTTEVTDLGRSSFQFRDGYLSRNLTVGGDLTVTGKITAREFHTTFVSASIIYQSGSTQFGNSSDDTHIFTGKVGVGATPTARLDLSPPSSQGTLSTLGYSANAQLNIRIPNSVGDVGQIVFTNDAAPTAGYASIGTVMTSGAGVGLGDIVMATKAIGSDAASLERLRITSDGNVGIGTTAPATKLQVNGTFASNALWTDGSSIGYWGGYPTAYGGLTWDTGHATVFATGGNRLQFGSNGSSPDMTIGTGGNVGIGTTSPADLLHIYGGSADQFLKVQNTSTYTGLWLEDAGTNNGWLLLSGYTDGAAAGDFAIREYGVQTSLTIKQTSGNVGIGNTAPNQKLELSVGNGVTGGLRINYAASATSEGMDITYLNTGATVTSFDSRYISDSAVMQFRMKTYGGSPVTAMTILGSGNIGVGVAAPLAKIHISGSSQNTLAIDSGAYPEITFRVGGVIKSYDAIATTATGFFTTSGVGDRIYRTEAGNHLFGYSSNELMRITTAGNVGIGTTGPSSKLHIKQTGIADNTATTLLLLDGQFNDSSIEEADMVSIGFRVENSSGGSQSSQAISFAYDNTLSLMKDGGKVGIGITTPSNRLTVYQGGGVRVTGITSGDWIEMSGNLPGYSDNQYPVIKSNGTIHFANNNKYSAFLEGANTYFGILDSSTVTRVFLTTSGNTYFTGGAVGIGTTNPASILNTSGAGNGITHDDSTAGKGYIRFRNSGTQLALFGIAGAWEGSSLQDTMVAAETGLNIRMYTNGSATPKMFISGSGNVGVGTTGPVGKLTVEGDGSANNTSGLIRIANTGGSTWGGIALVDGQTTVTNASNYYLIGRAGALTDRAMSFHIPTAADYGSGSQPKIAFYSTGATVLYSVEASTGTAYHRGSVGIGTTGPLSELHVQGSSTEQILISLDSTKRMLMGRTSGYGWIAPYTNGVSYDNLVLARDGGNVGIGSTGPRAKLDVAGGITLRNSRVSTSEKYPVGHYSFGETVFEIDPTWTESQLQEFFNSSGVTWTADSTAPGGYAIQIDGGVNVGGVDYSSGFPYIPVDSSQDDWYYMECYIRNEAGSVNQHYMGGIDFNQNFGVLGGNPGSYTYNVMLNYSPGTSWTKVYGYWNGFGNSAGSSGTGNTNNWEAGTKYFTPQALFNYTNSSGTRRCYISGWKCVRVRSTGNRYYSDNVLVNGSVGIGTTSPAHKLSVIGQGTGVAHVGDAGFGSGNYTGISLNGTLSTTAYNFLSSPSDNHLYINRPSGNNIYFRSDNSNQVTINSNGNVGIGVTTPDRWLTVLRTGAANGTQQQVALFANNATGATSAAIYIGAYTGTDWLIGKNIYGTSSLTNFQIGDQGVSTSYFDIITGGNIGIGTTSPTTKVNILIGAGGTNGTTGLKIGGTSNYDSLELGIEGDYNGQIRTYGNDLHIYAGHWRTVGSTATEDHAIRFFTSKTSSTNWSTAKMILTADGTVGIGSNSPSRTLDVNGNARIGNNTAQQSHAALQVSAGQGSATTYRDIDMCGSWAGGEGHAITANYGTSIDNIVGQIVFEHNGPGSRIKFGRLYDGGNQSTYPMHLVSNGSAGRLGIGTSVPTAPLDTLGVRVGRDFSIANRATVRLDSNTADYPADILFGHTAAANESSWTGVYWSLSSRANDASNKFYIYRAGGNPGGSGEEVIMALQPNGNIGIGVTNPGYKLEVAGTAYVSDDLLVGATNATSWHRVSIATGGFIAQSGNKGIGVYRDATDSNTELFSYDYGGSGYLPLNIRTSTLTLTNNGGNTMLHHNGTNVGIGTISPAYKLDVSGTIRATGDVIAYSDARVKENIVTLENSLELVQKLRGVSYNKIGESEKKIGVIAQEVLEVLPEVVQQDSEGTYSVAYGNITAVLIEAIKQQQLQIDELKAEIKNLKSR